MKRVFLFVLVIIGMLFTACDEENEQEKTPETIKIYKVEIQDFPSLNNSGNEWDNWSSGPDIYFKVFLGNSLIYEHDTYQEDASDIFSFNLSKTININVIADNVYVELYDYDSANDDDYMNYANGVLYEEGDGKPGYKSLSNGSVSVGLYFNYEY